MMTRRLLTAKDVAEILRTTPGRLANQRMNGEGPPYLKFERRVLYDSKELEKWIDGHRVITN